jgi:trehalose 6-phosphate synthase
MTSQISMTALWLIVLGSLALSAFALVLTFRRSGRGAAEREAVSAAAVGPLRETERLTAAEDALVHWSPEMLRQILRTELPDGDLIVVSNREPYVHERVRGRIQLQVPASGLVSALEPITRTCAGTWIAHGSGSADMETVDAGDRLAVPPSNPAYTLRRVWLTEEEY